MGEILKCDEFISVKRPQFIFARDLAVVRVIGVSVRNSVTCDQAFFFLGEGGGRGGGGERESVAAQESAVGRGSFFLPLSRCHTFTLPRKKRTPDRRLVIARCPQGESSLYCLLNDK